MTTKDVLIRLGVATDKAGAQSIKDIRRGLKSISGKSMLSGINNIGKSLSGIISVAKTAAFSIGLMAIPFTMVVGSAMGFDKAMAEVSTIVDTSKVNMANLRKEVHDLSIEMGKSPEELTKGLYQTISAGIDAADAMSFLKLSTKAAIAGVAESREAVDLLTTVINSYGMSAKEAGRISDVAFESVRLGKTTFSELASSMGNVSSIASQANISVEEMFASVTTLTKAGIDTATAATYLKNSLVGIIKPSDQAAAAAKQYGVELNASALKSKGFIGVLQQIKEKTKGNVTSITELFPNIRGMSAVMALAGNSSKEFADILTQLEHATGATDVAFEKMESSSAVKIEKALNAIKVVGMDIGSEILPMIVDEIEKVGGAQGIFDSMSGSWRELKENIVAVKNSIAEARDEFSNFSDEQKKEMSKPEHQNFFAKNFPMFYSMGDWAGQKIGLADKIGGALGTNKYDNAPWASNDYLMAMGNINKNYKGRAARESISEALQKKIEDFITSSINNIHIEPAKTIDATIISDAVIDSQEKLRLSILKGIMTPMQNQNLAQSMIINSATVG
jgi:TP901 family phage tail tape measure protein